MMSYTLLSNPIHCIQAYALFKRWCTYLVLSIFSFVWYAPSVHAALEYEPPHVVTPSSEQDFNRVLDQVLFTLEYHPGKQKLLQEQQETLTELAQDIKQELSSAKEHQLLYHFQVEYARLNNALTHYLNTDDPQERFGYSQFMQDMIRAAHPSKARILSNDLDFNLPPVRAVHLDQNQINALVNYMPQSLPTSSYVNTDTLTQASPAITALANELGRDPQAMFEYVYNSIDYVPSYGVLQGGDYTLETKRGNAFDTSVLLTSLLKTAGIPTRFAYGTVGVPIETAKNWLGGFDHADSVSNMMQQGQIPHQMYAQGGKIEEVQFEHVWVQAYLNNQWINLDASIKQYETIQGVDLAEKVPFDTQALENLLNAANSNEQEGWVQGVNQTELQAELEGYQQALETYITEKHANDTVKDVLGGRSIQSISLASLAEFTVPFSRVITKATIQTIPESMWHRFKVQLGYSNGSSGNETWAGLLAELNQPTFQLVSKKLAVSFRPATPEDEQKIESLIPDNIETAEDLPTSIPINGTQMVGEITLDGEVIAATDSVTLGSSIMSRMGYITPEQSWRSKQNIWIAGEYHAIGLDLHGLSSQQLEALQTDLTQVKTQLEGESTTGLTKHDLVGNILQTGVQSYFAMTAANERLSALPADIISHRMPSFGTFSTRLSVSTFFGTPRSVNASGLAMDIDQYSFSSESKTNCYQTWLSYQRNISTMSSAFEHIVPEQMFSTAENPVEAVSTVKALAIAAQEGQKIYTITQENQQQLANVVIDSDARQEINNALAIGLEVTVHEKPIEFNSWVGSGYSLIDDKSGIGAWKISGGSSGAETTDDAANQASSSLGWLGLLGDIGIILGVGISAVLGGAIAIIGLILAIVSILLNPSCKNSAAVIGFVSLASILGVLVSQWAFSFAAILPLLSVILLIIAALLISFLVSAAFSNSCKEP